MKVGKAFSIQRYLTFTLLFWKNRSEELPPDLFLYHHSISAASSTTVYPVTFLYEL